MSNVRSEGDRTRRLLQVGRTLVSEHDTEAVLDRILHEARDVTGARYAALGVLDERRTELERFLTLGLDDATRLVCCRPPSPRALDPSLVARAAQDLGFAPEHIEVSESVRDAIGVALLSTPEDGQIVVTGSLYTVGAARGLLLEQHGRS